MHAIPWEVVENGAVVSDRKTVLNKWQTEYCKLYNEDAGQQFDDNHLHEVVNSVSTNSVPRCTDVDSSVLDVPISRDEILRAVNRGKCGKAAGLDFKPAEALNTAIVLIF